MQQFIRSMERAFDRVLGGLIFLSCVLLSMVTLSVCLEVVLRYFFNKPQVWVIELAEYSLLYITFLGAAWGLREEAHISVDLFTNLMGPRGRVACGFVSDAVCLAVSVILLVYGTRVSWHYFSRGLYNPTILEIPTAYILVVIPLGGLTLLVQSIRGGLRRIAAQAPPTPSRAEKRT
ncbi:MAG: TRAP transporter small permease [Deltaproteobacteria bacterium]|nr:TRAP transporter small permease [Deltaproteobacteria bacterium]